MNYKMREWLLDLARWYDGRRQAKLDSWSGADKTDAELHRLEALACRRLAQGEEVETVLADLQTSWLAFAEARNQQIEAGVRMTYGPSSGLSACHYMYADPNRGEYSACYIRQRHQDIARRAEPFDTIDQEVIHGQESQQA